MNRLVTIFVAGFIALMLLSSTIFVVDQRRYAIVFALGQVKDVIDKPGLHFKLPPPFQNVVYMDKRILTLDTPDVNRFITSEKSNVLVDSFIKWRISDPRLYYVSFAGDEARAQSRLSQVIKAALSDEITKRTVREVISGQRAAVMAAVQTKLIAEAKEVGIGIVDVRLKRVEYTEQNINSVYERMRAERVRVANESRSTGAAESEQIRADADRQRTVIIAEAFRDAEKVKGDGDAKASAIYADAFGKNPEFARYYRSLEAYRASFKDRSDVLVVDPNSEFFKYFKAPAGGGK
ncbi:protease modulator HflC [Oxalobacteraceae sp. CFBP 8763]|nr:protease modulator HflC [Oxalobacteraceae sp. CFBP 8763]